jgi:hypothetical protein
VRLRQQATEATQGPEKIPTGPRPNRAESHSLIDVTMDEGAAGLAALPIRHPMLHLH